MSGSIVITVNKANNLIDRDTVGCSDPYCLVFDPSGKQLLKTNTIDNNLNPVWPADKATVDWSITSAGDLKFQLFDEDTGSDEFLGECFVSVGELTMQRTGTKEFQLKPRKDEKEKEVLKAKSLGSVTVSWVYKAPPPPTPPVVAPLYQTPPSAQANTLPYGAPPAQPQAPYGVPPVQPQAPYGAPPVQPQAPYGAPPVQPQAPYGAPTPVQPQAPLAASVGPIPVQPVAPIGKLVRRDKQPVMPVAVTPLAAPSGSFQAQPSQQQFNPAPMYSTPQQSMGGVASGSFQAVPSQQYASPQQGYPPPASQQPQNGVIRITVKKGRNLLDVDGFGSGESDPFVVVHDPTGKKILQTPHLDNTLNPDFPPATATVEYKFTQTDGFFKFVVWDDESLGDPQFMGETSVPVKDMVDRVRGEGEFALKPRSGETFKKVIEAKGKLGTLTVEWSVTFTAAPLAQSTSFVVPPAAGGLGVSTLGVSQSMNVSMNQSLAQSTYQGPREGRLRIQVVRGNNLLDRDMAGQGVSDPYVVVFDPSGKQIIKTKPIDDNLNPQWPAHEATAEWPLPTIVNNKYPTGAFTFHVFDADVGGDDFLGEVKLAAADLIRSQKGENICPLRPRDGETDSVIRSNSGKLGTITVSWELVLADPTGSTKSVSLAQSQALGLSSRPQVIEFPGNLSVTIVRCEKLLNLEMFGTSDPYVIAFNLDGSSKAHTTPVMESTLNPSFPPAKSVYIVKLENQLGNLKFHVMDKETTFDKFMGEAVIDIVSVLSQRELGEIEIPLRPRPNEPDKDIAKAASLGSLFIKAQYEKVNVNVQKEVQKSTDLPQPTQVIPRRSVPGSLTLVVKRAVELQNQETFSISDPYCIVVGPDGGEIIRTPEVEKNLNPVWPSQKSGATLRITNSFLNGNFAFTIMDKDVTSDSLMGKASLPLEYILTHANGDVVVDVKDPKGKDGGGKLVVGFAYTPESTTASQVVRVQLPGTIKIVVTRANGLCNLETVGTSDPYVTLVGPNGKLELTTPVAPSTLNPVFPSDKSKALINVKDRQGLLTFQVYDKNVTTDEFMGEATIKTDDLLCRPNGEITLPLMPRSNEQNSKLRGGSLGTVTFDYTYAQGGIPGSIHLPKIQGCGRMTMKIEGCQSLIPMDSTTSDPYVELFIGGSKKCRTTTIKNTVNPSWKGNDGLLDFFIDDPSVPIVLEIRDEDMTSDDLEGKVQLIPAQMDQSGDLTLPLLSERLLADKNRGAISFSWTFVQEKLGEDTTPRIRTSGKITITIESCQSLIKRSTFSQEPCVSARYKGEEVFKTPKGNSLNPTWVKSQSTFSQFLYNINEPIELFVADGDKFQGRLELIPSRMGAQGKSQLSLRPRPQESDPFVTASALGTMTITWAFEEQRFNPNNISQPGFLNVRIIGASDLISQDTAGDMELYAQVFYAAKEVLKTAEVPYSCKKGSALWPTGDGSCTTSIQLTDPTLPIMIQLWDKDLTSSDFLGEATLLPTEQLKSGEKEFLLRPRANETDKTVLQASLLGHVRVSWVFTLTQENVTVTTIKQEDASPADKSRGIAPAPPSAPTWQPLDYQANGLYAQDSIIAGLNNMSAIGGGVDQPDLKPHGSGYRLVVRLSQVRGMRFQQVRDDPEVVVSLMHNAQEFRSSPAASDGKDASIFALNSVMTITPKAGDQVVLRVFDAEDLWGGQPLGAALLQWEDVVPVAQNRHPQQKRVYSAALLDARGHQRGEILYFLTAEEKNVSAGEIRYEVREAKDFTTIPRAPLLCRSTVGSTTNMTKPVSIINNYCHFGSVHSAPLFTNAAEQITLELLDAQTGEVVSGGVVSIVTHDKKLDGSMWVTLMNLASRQPNGVVFVQWRSTQAQRRPLADYMTPPDGTSVACIEVLHVRGFNPQQHESSAVSVQVEQNNQAIARCGAATVTPQSPGANFGAVFYLPVAPEMMQKLQQSALAPTRPDPTTPWPQCTLRLVDEATTQSLGEATLTVGTSEVETWINMTNGKQALVRCSIITAPQMSSLTFVERALVVRIKRFEPNNSLHSDGEYFLSAEGGHEASNNVNANFSSNGGGSFLQCTPSFRGEGIQQLDYNLFFPAHLFPRGVKRFPLNIHLHEGNEKLTSIAQRLSTSSAFVSKLRRGGELVLDMHNMTRVVCSYLWVDLYGSHIGKNPNVKTVSISEATLRNNITERYDALSVQLSSGGLPCKSAPSADPTTRAPKFVDQFFNIVEGTVTMPIRISLVGLKDGGAKEETIGISDLTMESLTGGKQLIAMRRRADDVGTVLVETSVTGEIEVKEKLRTSARGRDMHGASNTDTSFAVRVQFAVGRAFGTRMEPHEPLDVLRPYLSRHFAVLEEDQQLMWNSRPVDTTKTIPVNKLRTGDDGILSLTLTSLNKRVLYLLVKTPSGKGVVVSALPQTTVMQLKSHLSERDDTDLDGEPPNGIRLMCNYTELADEEALGFYRMQTGQTLVAMLKPRTRSGKLSTLPSGKNGSTREGGNRISLRVEDPYGEETVVHMNTSEPISTLRKLLSDDDNVRSDIFVNGQRILNEDDTLQALDVTRTSMVQFLFKSLQLNSPSKPKDGAKKFITLDVEGIDGSVAKVEIPIEDPVSVVRELVPSDPSAALYFNGRAVRGESRTFRELEIKSGGYMQIKYPGGRMGGGEFADPATAYREKELALQRQRATEGLQMAVLELQRQLDQARATQGMEKTLQLRVMHLEKELDDFHQKYQNALDRVRELEDTVERQYTLLKRATEATSSSSLYNSSFQPQVTLRSMQTPTQPLRSAYNTSSSAPLLAGNSSGYAPRGSTLRPHTPSSYYDSNNSGVNISPKRYY